MQSNFSEINITFIVYSKIHNFYSHSTVHSVVPIIVQILSCLINSLLEFNVHYNYQIYKRQIELTLFLCLNLHIACRMLS